MEPRGGSIPPAKQSRVRAVLWAGSLALALHIVACALLALVWRAGESVGAADSQALVFRSPSGVGMDEGETWVDLTPADLVDPAWAAAPAAATPKSDEPRPEADIASSDPRRAALRWGLAGERRAPSTDSGDQEGRPLPPAWRHDVSLLRSRLDDGAAVYQPSRERNSALSSSPQAVRREPLVGPGDSARTRQPRLVEPSAPEPVLPASTGGDEELERLAVPEKARVGDWLGRDKTRGEGPLDASEGRRAFDVARVGPAGDNVEARAASNEPRPGLVDYAAVSARGPTAGASGRGPATQAGVVSQPTGGSAPSAAGSPQPSALTGQPGEGATERKYSREYQEIRHRVARALRFPQRLALLLLQGEAIVQFVVQPDGRVLGEVKLLKSAGYEEFDREAIDVIRRAAPFAPVRRSLTVRMRIPFENPVIR
jgi:TonB family protein